MIAHENANHRHHITCTSRLLSLSYALTAPENFDASTMNRDSDKLLLHSSNASLKNASSLLGGNVLITLQLTVTLLEFESRVTFACFQCDMTDGMF